jgi:alkaline phosphatase D
VVWDDHESANNSWKGGAENHDAGEGDWQTRKANAIRAWYEWLPVREWPFVPNGLIYRTFRFGDLADLILLDTRIIGRDEQVDPTGKTLPQILSEVYDPNRSLLGSAQESWFFNQLTASQQRGVQWRLVGQQIMMGHLMVAGGRPVNLDQWDGYGASRLRLLWHLLAGGISNVVVLSGDLHSSWANEIAFNPFQAGGYQPLAVEFVGPGITSPAILDEGLASILEGLVDGTHPHVKYVDVDRRGYFLVDLDRERVQAEWYYPDTVLAPSDVELFGYAARSASGTNLLVPAGGPSAPKPGAPPLAP